MPSRPVVGALDLDATDLAILRCLQEDARRSLRDVAKRVGVSTPTVSARLSALEELGIVRGFHADLDPERLEQTSFALVVRARLPATEAVAEAIAKEPWARWVSVARSGRVLVEATVQDPRALDQALAAVAAIPGVVEAEHYVALRTVKEEPRALVGDRAATALVCFECRGPVRGEPIRVRLDGRDHFFCCRSCERLYRERYARIKARASESRPRRR